MTSTSHAPPDAAVAAAGLTKVYGDGATSVVALDGVEVTIARGQFTAIMGPSGSGKSTLLHCLAGLEEPTSGQVVVAGTQITGLGDDQLTRLRRDRVGLVFQAFNLVPTLTALENITLPLELAGHPARPGPAGRGGRHARPRRPAGPQTGAALRRPAAR
jgi:putative ABC transport system ATP-binding protein